MSRDIAHAQWRFLD